MSCSDKVDENLEAIPTHDYLIWPEVVEGCTEYTARFSIECAQREGCILRKEIEQLGIELQYISTDFFGGCEISTCLIPFDGSD